ncbi:hypothetical protein H311_01879 [Anncaliia algerae PRA109]|nr:hypothetical protein H311_01879 [Anncaliia algerae PRA109]
MVLEENVIPKQKLTEIRSKLMDLLKGKKYSMLISMCNKATQPFLLSKRDYDRTSITPYDNKLAKYFNLSGYVNGSLLEEHKKIAAQLPKKEFLNDFLSLLINSECKLIVSLVDCESEDYFVKTHLLKRQVHYYQDKMSFCDETYAFKENYTIRRLRYLGWNDFSIPKIEEFTIFMDYYWKIKCDSYVLIHCLAGVGRTGTFIMFDILSKLPRITYENFIDTLIYLRSQRAHMVYNSVQLEFLAEYFLRS